MCGRICEGPGAINCMEVQFFGYGELLMRAFARLQCLGIGGKFQGHRSNGEENLYKKGELKEAMGKVSLGQSSQGGLAEGVHPCWCRQIIEAKCLRQRRGAETQH
uniref:Uncharacterized protein n=1 Tax=Physcomitrium patens TaxID=3218 RepID=A0A2K1ISL2_PHYPA|nr:hypothetical protein PHYPA_026395 [Physcomitrium patens]